MPSASSANPYTFKPKVGEADPWAASRPQLTEQQAIIARNNRTPDLVQKLATAAVLGIGTAGAGMALAGGGAAAAGGIGGLPAGMAPGGAMIGGSATAPLAAGGASAAAGGGGLMSMQTVQRALPLLGRIFGNAAAGSANQRGSENELALRAAQIANQDILARGSLQSANANTRASMQNQDSQFRTGLDLQRKQFLQSEPNKQARQALAGSLLSRISPVQIAGMPEGMGVRSGILDAIGPEAREAGSLLAQRGLSGLQSGPTKFDDMPAVSLPDILNLPASQIAEMQHSGLLEKIMGGFGVGASVVGALGDMNSVGGNGRTYDPTDENGFG